MSSTDRPNILWFCTDQQRWDTIRVLGNPHIRTPTVDALVGAGTAFTRAYVQSTVCTPSRASFLTGRYAASHHVYRNGNAYFPREEVLVTKLLADAGYDCGLIGKLHLAGGSRGFEPRVDDGYRYWQWSFLGRPDDGTSHNNAYHHWLRGKGIDPRELWGPVDGFMGPGVPAALHQTTWAAEKTVEFISERRDGRPWLLSLNPFDPHHPFDPAPEYLARMDMESLPHPAFRPSDLERQKAFAQVQHQSVVAIDPTVREPEDASQRRDTDGDYKRVLAPPRHYYGREVKAAYYAMIEHLDDAFATIMAALKSTGQLENTIVIFTSDHGEMLGDHGLIFKGARFFEGAVRVPLVFSWPGRIQAGLRSDALVESIDIAPTLLEAAGLPVPHLMQGRSLLPIMTGQADAAFHKPRVLCDFNESMGYLQPGVAERTQATMTVDGRHKLVVYHRQNLFELFDLEADPDEFDNLWEAPAYRDLRWQIYREHMDAVMRSVSAGPDRIGLY